MTRTAETHSMTLVMTFLYLVFYVQEKHAYLRSLGVKYITSSRSGNKFEADMKIFLEKEAAEGVDVVLNSLSHDDYISRSLACLKSGGRFIEIGKRGIWSHQSFGHSINDMGGLCVLRV